MLLQIKVYLIGTMYVLGTLFMFLFPPRNFYMSGSRISTKRSIDDNKLNYYVYYEKLQSMVTKLAREHPEVVNLVQLVPPTAENRSVLAVELRSDKLSRKPGILIIGGLDAMAWGAPSAIMELTNNLLYDAGYQTPYFNDYDWYLIPMANPDGITFTQSRRSLPPIDPLEWSKNDTARPFSRPSEWHKNVDKETESEKCFGTNINRNFPYHWQDDVRKFPPLCSQYYPGAKPFTTAEAKAIRKYVDSRGADISLAIHLHVSFVPKKEYILYPWRFSLRLPSNHRTLQEIGEYAARKARLPDGRLYEVHQSSSDERAAGTLSDYVLGVVGVDLVFLIRPYHQMYPNITDYSVLSTTRPFMVMSDSSSSSNLLMDGIPTETAGVFLLTTYDGIAGTLSYTTAICLREKIHQDNFERGTRMA